MSHRATRVWIELEKPTGREFTSDPVLYRAECERRAELATNMLKRLNDGDSEGQRFFWSERDHRYCFGGNWGYTVLANDGQWFNLEHFGRPL